MTRDEVTASVATPESMPAALMLVNVRLKVGDPRVRAFRDQRNEMGA